MERSGSSTSDRTSVLSDFAGRVGGEEFVVFAPDTSSENARVLGEKTAWRVESVLVRGIERAVTASVGIAAYPIKRDRGVKDYGAPIGGHGGVQDRIDGLTFAAPVFVHVTRFFF